MILFSSSSGFRAYRGKLPGVLVCKPAAQKLTHTHTHIYIYISFIPVQCL